MSINAPAWRALENRRLARKLCLFTAARGKSMSLKHEPASEPLQTHPTLTPHPAPLTPHTLHLTPHTSHLTPHTSPQGRAMSFRLESFRHERLRRAGVVTLNPKPQTLNPKP